VFEGVETAEKKTIENHEMSKDIAAKSE
jgi:hypothetical protein